MEILKIYTRRSHYGMADAAEGSLTVGELKEILEEYDDEVRVVTCATADFCKYGALSRQSFEEEYDGEEE